MSRRGSARRRQYRGGTGSDTLGAGAAAAVLELPEPPPSPAPRPPSMSLLRGNHYEVLTLKPGASPEQVEKAYRLCLTLYRDNGAEDEGNKAARERVEQAYSVLHDADRREEYDRAHGFPVM